MPCLIRCSRRLLICTKPRVRLRLKCFTELVGRLVEFPFTGTTPMLPVWAFSIASLGMCNHQLSCCLRRYAEVHIFYQVLVETDPRTV